MPRIARPHTEAIREGQTTVRQFLSIPGNSQAELARRAGVAPYTVNRLLAGRIKGITEDVQRILDVANTGNAPVTSSVMANVQLARAVQALWDGTDQGMQRLIAALEAAAPLLRLITWEAPNQPSTGSR